MTSAAGKSAPADLWLGGLGPWNSGQGHLAGQIDDRSMARTSARRWFRRTIRRFFVAYTCLFWEVSYVSSDESGLLCRRDVLGCLHDARPRARTCTNTDHRAVSAGVRQPHHRRDPNTPASRWVPPGVESNVYPGKGCRGSTWSTRSTRSNRISRWLEVLGAQLTTAARPGQGRVRRHSFF